MEDAQRNVICVLIHVGQAHLLILCLAILVESSESGVNLNIMSIDRCERVSYTVGGWARPVSARFRHVPVSLVPLTSPGPSISSQALLLMAARGSQSDHGDSS